jgi:hypothetical protein
MPPRTQTKKLRTQSEKQDPTEYSVPGTQAFSDDFTQAQRALREAIEQQKMGVEGLLAARFQLLRVFGRIERMQEQIDVAFAGQPFLADVVPTAPANTQRFKAFMERHERAMKLQTRAIELWILTCGVRWECDSKTCAAHNCPARGKRPRARKSIAK